MSGFSHKILMISYGCKILHHSAPVISPKLLKVLSSYNSSVKHFLERLIGLAE